MNEKLVLLARQAGFPADKSNHFVVKQKYGLFGTNDLVLNENIEKFATLLFDEFMNAWWVANNKDKIEKPW